MIIEVMKIMIIKQVWD